MSVKRSRLTAADVRGAWAVVPTPAKPNAGDWRADDTVDLDEAARVVDELIRAGIDGILTLGTLSECAALTWEEKRAFIATCVEAVAGRVPFFAGTTTLGTRETIRQTREASALGADGTMLGLPMWCELDTANAIQFYRDVAEACPETAICVYANPAAFKYKFTHDFWEQVAEIPQVVTSKYLDVAQMAVDLPLVKGRIRLLPVASQYVAAAKAHPEECTAFWTSAAVCGPAPVIRLRDEVSRAKETGDWSVAEQIAADVQAGSHGLMPNENRAEFFRYNVQLELARIAAAGWMRVGPPRPPHTHAPAEYVAGAERSGKAWAEIHARYAGREATRV